MGDAGQEIQLSPNTNREDGGHGDTSSNNNNNILEESKRDNPTEEGLEVYCGRIPKELKDDEIRPLFETCGPVIEFRLPKFNETNQNRGFAFIRYQKKEDALKAITKLNGKQIRRRQYLRVTRSYPNCRLFVGNIPKAKGKEELMREFANRTVGLKDVIIYSSPDDERKNRGFCFLEYESHKAASLAKRKLSFRDIKIWGCDILVDWADPLQEVDDEVMSKVRILYIKNVSSAVPEEELRRIFSAYGKLDRVKKMKDFAFIHYAKREEAADALAGLQGIKLHGASLNISWAKPPTDKETRQQVLRAREKRILQQQALKPARVAVNPFPIPQSNNYFYHRRPTLDMDRGDHVYPLTGIGSSPLQRQIERDQLPLPPPIPFVQVPPPTQRPQQLNPTSSSEESLYPNSLRDNMIFSEPPIPRISSTVFRIPQSETEEEEALPGFSVFRPKNKVRQNRTQRNYNRQQRNNPAERNNNQDQRTNYYRERNVASSQWINSRQQRNTNVRRRGGNNTVAIEDENWRSSTSNGSPPSQRPPPPRQWNQNGRNFLYPISERRERSDRGDQTQENWRQTR